MEKRYQVFISSTFTDLKDERQAVLKGILEIDHMPAGMELFPAADDTAWQLIQDVIDASDYYVVIVGGRYGSLDETGLSYTEKEYDYALAQKKPVIPLLHEKPDNLPREKTETDEATWRCLKNFREKVEKRHTCVYWRTAEDLKAKVITGLTAAIKRHPAVGWVRADQVPSQATLADLLALRQRVAELEAEVEAERQSPPEGTQDLMQGEDGFELRFSFTARRPEDSFLKQESFSATIEITWNEMFAAVAPTMINEAVDRDLRRAFRTIFERKGHTGFRKDEELKGKVLDFRFTDDQIDTCIVQFRALGLIRESTRPRSVHDKSTYWKLTPYGDHLMTQLRALRRPSSEPVEVTARAIAHETTKRS